jgi:peptidoglycan/LPS O-acetylase OafA/YrhL
MTKGEIPIMDRASTWGTLDTESLSTSYEGVARKNKTSATRATRLVPLAVAVLLITIFLFGVLLPVAHMFNSASGNVVVP